ncbi:MAG TPA: GNAT family N-acetyltransferase [Vicinamibacterales bacterium]
MQIEVRLATAADAPLVAAILAEVDAWVAQLGTPMWELGEVDQDRIAAEVAKGLFALAWSGSEAAGTVRFQLEDPEFWPDRPGDNAAYIHRLAVRRKFAGGAISTALMTWAVDRARSLRRDALRLDCDADRTSLRAVYERFGFVYHSDRQVGPYYVARYEYRLA